MAKWQLFVALGTLPLTRALAPTLRAARDRERWASPLKAGIPDPTRAIARWKGGHDRAPHGNHIAAPSILPGGRAIPRLCALPSDLEWMPSPYRFPECPGCVPDLLHIRDTSGTLLHHQKSLIKPIFLLLLYRCPGCPGSIARYVRARIRAHAHAVENRKHPGHPGQGGVSCL